MSDAVLAIAGELGVDDVLQKLADESRELVKARYAAIGVPDGEGGFAKFITSGMTEAQLEALGELPRTHGLLGAMLESPEPFRTADIMQDPRFEGWPDEHPRMHAFLGVPIVANGRIVGAFYLTDRRGRRHSEFTQEDEELIVTLAAHAAIALEHARLFERSRELSIVEERNRLARELHDSVTQTLFSVGLTAEAAALLVDSDPVRAREQIIALRDLARTAMDEMRSLIFELRPADLAADGLAGTLAKHVEILQRVHGTRIELAVSGERRLEERLERCLYRIAQEAIANALKHARASTITVAVELDGHATITVSDDGLGFDPGAERVRGRRLGLTSMRERAEELGGTLRVESRPGAGTTVTVEVEVDQGSRR
jgi:signal transduction histidine kinase